MKKPENTLDNREKEGTGVPPPINVLDLHREDFATHAAFRLTGVDRMSPGDQLCAKVTLREAAKKLGYRSDEFEILWNEYMEGVTARGTVRAGHLPAEIEAVYDSLQLRENGWPASTTGNLIVIMTTDPNIRGRIRYNEFSQRPEREGPLPWSTGRDGSWTDVDDAELTAYIEKNYHIANRSKLMDALNIVAHMHSFHPVIERLEALPDWDGIERIGRLLPEFLGAEESPYTAEVTLNWMLGAISRVYHPGCKYDYVIILTGEQGAGKSTLLRMMSLEDDWFDDSIGALSGRENAEKLQGKWIVELQELKALKREKDAESVKAFITTQTDYYREPYARRPADHPRQCVFAGTTNEDSFLTDRSGNRRFIPIEVGGTDPGELFTPDCETFIEQCWAEALAKFRKAGCRPNLILSQEAERQAAAQQARHLEEDVRVSLIQGWLDRTPEIYVSIMDIWLGALLSTGMPSRKETNELHRIMKHDIHGWREAKSKHRTASSPSPARCYERIAPDEAESAAEGQTFHE